MLSFAPAWCFDYNFLLKIPIDSGLLSLKRKFNSLQLFQKYRKPNFNVFQAKNAIQVAAENSNIFEHFFVIFEIFHRSYLFLYPNCFSKEQIRCHKGKTFLLFLKK